MRWFSWEDWALGGCLQCFVRIANPCAQPGWTFNAQLRFFVVRRWIDVGKIALGGLKCLIALSALGSGGPVVTLWGRNGKWSGSLKPVIYSIWAFLAPEEGSEVRLQELNWKENQKRDVLLWICWPGSREISGNSVRPHRICHQVLLIWVISQEEYIVLAK